MQNQKVKVNFPVNFPVIFDHTKKLAKLLRDCAIIIWRGGGGGGGSKINRGV